MNHWDISALYNMYIIIKISCQVFQRTNCIYFSYSYIRCVVYSKYCIKCIFYFIGWYCWKDWSWKIIIDFGNISPRTVGWWYNYRWDRHKHCCVKRFTVKDFNYSSRTSAIFSFHTLQFGPI